MEKLISLIFTPENINIAVTAFTTTAVTIIAGLFIRKKEMKKIKEKNKY